MTTESGTSVMPRTITAASAELRLGRLSPVDLLDECLAAIDRYEPRVRAWVLVDRESARADAERAAKEIGRGEWRGPLHGIPVGIKDIIDVFDWPTAAGSKLWAQSIAREDAPVVQKLRQAGAVFVGKTVTTPYASFDPPPTHNPWNLSRTPGGSSSGSAAAVACGMCLAALASQTGGSITRPASYCGVASVKPSHGFVSTRGVVPLAPSMDHVGAMARSVRDLAIVLTTIAGPTADGNGVPVIDLSVTLGSPLQPPRLGVLGGLFEELAHPSVRALMETTVTTLRERGAQIVRLALPASFREVLARHRIVMAVEAAAYHQRRLERHPEDYGPCIRKLLDEGLACPAPEYDRCRKHKEQLTREVLTLLFSPVDALLTPATTCPAPDAATTGDPAFNSPWSYTGLPTISLPAGLSPEGLPLSIQLVGRPWNCEVDLFPIAAWCEAALGVGSLVPPL